MPFVVSPPALDLAAAIWGKEGRHTWDDAITLGDTGEWPNATIDVLTGLADLADAEDIRGVATGRGGEVAYRSVRRGKTVSYEGRLRATSRNELRAMQAAARAAFADEATEKQMVVTPPDFALPDGDTFLYTARALAFTSPDAEVSPFRRSRGHERPYALTVRMSDPRHYTATLNQETDPTAPLLVTCDAGGNAPSDPQITLRLRKASTAANTLTSMPGFLLSRTAVGDETAAPFLYVPLSLGYTDEYVVVDFAARRVFIRTTAGVEAELPYDESSTWWDADVPGLAAGESQQVGVSYVAGTPAAGQPYLSDLTVEWRDAWW